MKLQRPFGGLLLAAIIGAGCADEVATLYVARCVEDIECGPGHICDNGECVPKNTVSCQEVEGGAAILQPGPPVVDFSRVGPATTFQTLKLRNIGDCTLTIFETFFEGGDELSFECPKCTPDRFPIELFPFREEEVEIAFTPDREGEFRSELHLLSDDGEYSEIRVPVRARFDGVPLARVLPDQLSFGYSQVGRSVTRSVQVSNHGVGAAPLIITDIRVHPTGTTAFSYEPELMENIEL